MLQKIRLLHLSDLHIPADVDKSEEFRKFRDNFLEDLKMEQKRNGNWDVLVISGDLIDKGHVEVFKKIEFKGFINEILDITGISKNAIIIVPGNHDAARPSEASGLNVIRNKKDEKINLDETNLQELEVRFNNFRKACNSLSRKLYKKNLTSGIKDIKIGNVYYRFIMLNSALGTRDKCDYNNLFVSSIQLDYLLKEINKSIKPEITFLVMHHPIDWLSYQERRLLEEYMQDEKGLNVDIVLHGHIHDGQINLVSNLDSNIVFLVTGIGYEKGELYSGGVEHSKRPNHYRYATYEICKSKNLVHGILRKSNNVAVFKPDTSMYKRINQDGEFEIPLKLNYKLETYSIKIPINGDILLTPQLLSKMDFVVNKTRDFRNYMLRDIETSFKVKKAEKTATEKIMSVFMQLCINFKLFYFSDIENSNIRVHLRHYYPADETDKAYHGVFMSYCGRDENKIPVSKIIWGNKNNLIYHAYKEKRALIGTINKNNAYTNPDSEWDEYITIALTYKNFTPSSIPPLSFGVSFKLKNLDQEKIDGINMVLFAMSYLGIDIVLQEIISYLDLRLKIKNNIIPIIGEGE